MCKHGKKVISSQTCISINSCNKFFPVSLNQSKYSLEPKNILRGLCPLNPLLRGSDPSAPLMLATHLFLLCSQQVLMIYILNMIKWHLNKILQNVVEIYHHFLFVAKSSTCHAFNMLIEDQSFILIFS